MICIEETLNAMEGIESESLLLLRSISCNEDMLKIEAGMEPET